MALSLSVALLILAYTPAYAQPLHRCPRSDGSTYLSNLPCPPRDSGAASEEQKARDEAVLRSLQEKRQTETSFQARTRARAVIRQQWAEQAAERRRLALPPPHQDWRSQVEDFVLVMGRERINISRAELEQLLHEEAEARR